MAKSPASAKSFDGRPFRYLALISARREGTRGWVGGAGGNAGGGKGGCCGGGAGEPKGRAGRGDGSGGDAAWGASGSDFMHEIQSLDLWFSGSTLVLPPVYVPQANRSATPDALNSKDVQDAAASHMSAQRRKHGQ